MRSRSSRRFLISFVLPILTIWSGTTFAQQMYRCGSTFSQQPCGPDATVIKNQGMLQPSIPQGPGEAEKVTRMKALCREMLIRAPSWKDRDSLKVSEIYRGKADVRTIDGMPQVVRLYVTTVNGKNSYGAYTGDKPAVCDVNEHETKVLDLYTPS
jgi:hypothetical protein